jgi:hypothetical protein
LNKFYFSRDSNFVIQWDGLTKSSLLKSLNSDTTKRGRRVYENLLEVIDGAGYYSDSLKKVLSVRELFKIQILNKHFNSKGKFLVIEETRSGEYLQTNNYLFSINDNIIDSVYCFSLTDKGVWGLWKTSLVGNLPIKDCSFFRSKTIFGKGENLYSLIFSCFENNKITQSEFFPSGTLCGIGLLAQLSEIIAAVQ